MILILHFAHKSVICWFFKWLTSGAVQPTGDSTATNEEEDSTNATVNTSVGNDGIARRKKIVKCCFPKFRWRAMDTTEKEIVASCDAGIDICQSQISEMALHSQNGTQMGRWLFTRFRRKTPSA